MSEIVKFEDLQDRIIELRGQKILLDADVAQIYGVETRDINKAVTNNPDKFPAGYFVELSKAEKNELVENFHRFNRLKHSTVNPKAFPEKGLYMLATILGCDDFFKIAVMKQILIKQGRAVVEEVPAPQTGDYGFQFYREKE